MPQFQAPPLPPKAPSVGMFPVMQSTPVVSREEKTVNVVANQPADDFATRFNLPQTIYKTKTVFICLGAAVLFGLLLGIILFGGSSQPPVVQGLQGVVKNPDIRANEKLQRCGRVSETAGCVLYIVNHTRNDKLAEDFIPEAVKLTGRQDFLIRIENPNYVKTRIPAGHFASIKIPSLR